MRNFQEIWDLAAERHGKTKLKKRLPSMPSRRSFLRLKDDRFLAIFTKQIFRTGFVWRVIENKWPGFEDAFHGFDVERLAKLKKRDIDRLAKDERIVRHRAKIEAVRDNANFVWDMSKEHGSFARFVADWPDAEYYDLLLALKKDGSRLGGQTGAYALREIGRDGFIITKDVVKRLKLEKVVQKEPTSQRDRKAVQEAFNAWQDESEQGLATISRVLALSVD
ncbi:MAG: DNA-3-methyladenine glycosylase I [Myxococcota bacterium]